MSFESGEPTDGGKHSELGSRSGVASADAAASEQQPDHRAERSQGPSKPARYTQPPAPFGVKA
jgi:hypothetical protein